MKERMNAHSVTNMPIKTTGNRCFLTCLLAFTAMLAIILLTPQSVNAGTPEPITNGSGTSSDPYVIFTADEPAWLAERVNAGDTDYKDKSYKLANEIDLSDYGTSNTLFNDGNGWIPIRVHSSGLSDYGYWFSGTFDGDSHTITGLSIGVLDNPGGLFTAISDGGEIKNLAVEGVNINAHMYVGAIASYTVNGGRIKNCYSTGVVSGYSYVGGLVGLCRLPKYYGYDIADCYTESAVSGSKYVGGVVGCLEGVNINNCYAMGDVNTFDVSGSDIGGVVGYASAPSITNCYSTGNVTSDYGNNVGGVVGRFSSTGELDSRSYAEYCYATGNVRGNNSVGGVAGAIDNDYGRRTEMRGCYATGDVSGSDAIGGVVGSLKNNNGADSFSDAVVSQCYAIGKPTLQCVSVKLRGNALHAAACDGMRLMLVKDAACSPDEQEFLLPGRSLQLLASISKDTDEFEVGDVGSDIVFMRGDMMFSMHKLSGDYIDVNTVIKSIKPVYAATADAGKIKEALELLAVGVDNEPINLALLNGNIALRRNSDFSEAHAAVPSTVLKDTPETGFNYNIGNLCKLFQVVNGRVRLEIDAKGMMLVKTRNEVYVELPRRTSSRKKMDKAA